MNKVFLLLSMLLAFSAAAKTTKRAFGVGAYFEGSWIISLQNVDLGTGKTIGDTSFTQYNVTMTSENEYDIFQLEEGSYRRKQDMNQVIMSVTSNLTCLIRTFNADQDDFETLVDLHFIPLIQDISYVGLKGRCELDVFWDQSSGHYRRVRNSDSLRESLYSEDHFSDQ